MKRVMAWGVVLGLLIGCIPGLAAPMLKDNPTAYVFQADYEGPMMIMDENGVLRSGERFDTLYYVNYGETDIARQRFAGGKSKYVAKTGRRLLSALFTGEGRQLTGYTYRGFTMEDGSQWIAFEDADGLCGVMDVEANVVIEPRYAAVCALRNGGALALKQSPYPDGMDDMLYEMDEDVRITPVEIICVDPDGTEKPTGVLATETPFYVAEGRLCAMSQAGDYSVSMLLDESGRRVSDQDFMWLYQTWSGLNRIIAAVGTGYENARTGVIDLDGRWIIEPVYNDVSMPEPGVVDQSRLRYLCSDYGTTDDGSDFVARIIADDGSLVFTGEKGVRAYWLNDSVRWYRGEESWLTDTDGNRLTDVEIDGAGTRVTDDRYIQSVGDWPNTQYYLVDAKGGRIAGPFPWLENPIYATGYADHAVLIYREPARPRDMKNGALSDSDQSVENYLGLMTADGQRIGMPVYDTISSWAADRLYFRSGPNTGIMDIQGNWLYVQSDYSTLQD